MTTTLYLGDCLEQMDKISDGSIDLVLADVPYGITQNNWDTVIPLVPMWEQIDRVAKMEAAIVMTAAQPFTSVLILSNLANFKYSWVWDKSQVTNFLNSKKQPLRRTEDIPVFYRKQPVYNPQMKAGTSYTIRRKHATKNYGKQRDNSTKNTGYRYPDGIIDIAQKRNKNGHPTQKPVVLMEYMIKTYTNKGATVLDFTMGSGTVGVACKNLDRDFIGIELDPEYFSIAKERIEAA